MSDRIGEIRVRIDSCKNALARAEGEVESLETREQEAIGEIREILGCKKGEERQALTELREKIREGEAQVGELLDAAEEARDRKVEEEA